MNMYRSEHTRFAPVAYFRCGDDGQEYNAFYLYGMDGELEAEVNGYLGARGLSDLVCINGINFELEELYDYSAYVFEESGMDSPCHTRGILKLNGVVTPCIIFQDASPAGIYIHKDAFAYMPVGMVVADDPDTVTDWLQEHPEHLKACKEHGWSNDLEIGWVGDKWAGEV